MDQKNDEAVFGGAAKVPDTGYVVQAEVEEVEKLAKRLEGYASLGDGSLWSQSSLDIRAAAYQLANAVHNQKEMLRALDVLQRIIGDIHNYRHKAYWPEDWSAEALAEAKAILSNLKEVPGVTMNDQSTCDGPGEEDGPWAAGWCERGGTPLEPALMEEARRGIYLELECAELKDALKAMCEEFRGHDLPYGSKAYHVATQVLNKYA